ncbi:uncharacterized protein Z518_02066 [Rhinocladiella mackenziei CBS 650.93]|uniref:Uncharacterized protein n=1 Tax=Rhinocladiella mackenziei CBS 650.93 TaxID=1442369 RepID=A0A0D2HAB7_9EURO|nr:uncharacterized protein Z518_02066 [Rhinocladiella mackenziei CBS 650.93]KIX07413.1 hypothetical protein Z518_02066 [Rhinocladiella mackenziei CBS 650.93]
MIVSGTDVLGYKPGPAQTSTYSAMPFPPLPVDSASASESVPASAYLSSSQSSIPTQFSEPATLIVIPISASAPAPTPAPVINPRAPTPALAADDVHCSTAHSVFRLRARNPFAWLGRRSSETPEAMQSS